MRILPVSAFRLNSYTTDNNKPALPKTGYDSFTGSKLSPFKVFPDFGTVEFFAKNLKVLKPPQAIKKQIIRVADEINNSYPQNEPLTAVCVLRGGTPFFQELVKHLKMPVQMEYISVSSYGHGLQSSGKIKISGKLPDLNGKNVLIADDVVDTGNTLNELVKQFKSLRAKSVKTAVLYDKADKRVEICKDLKPDFAGFSEENSPFLIGYGLDLFGHGRGLPYIGAAKPGFVEKLKTSGLLDN
ncbi:MAG: hypothetical protein LBJ74_00465 [Heliobacteriaceae bacterium]|jgi:hypoxanthine phosphoribosyltransferase|nr:hypothetical protein [Heliobacteriaceae bacterium]